MSMREPPFIRARRSMSMTRIAAVTAMLIANGGCSDDDKSATELNAAGPPMVQQVFVQEREATGGGTSRERFRLAFGDHPDIPEAEDDRVVQNAVAFSQTAKIRVVLDELLVGNHIEEIQCSDGTFSRVPVGTDPDDIERCAGPDLSECEAVCIGPGGPIGINDTNEDGAVDAPNGLRMIDYGDGELAASVVCNGQRVPLLSEGTSDVTKRSFYNPSGNQLIPAGQGPDGLGPALVLFPALGLTTSASCTVTFRPEVVDKDDNRVCAPPGGDVSGDCADEGDTSAISFQVEPLAFRSTSPEQGAVATARPGNAQIITLEFVAELDPATLGGITVAAGGEDVPVEVALDEDAFRALVTVPDGFQPGTEYTVTAGTALTDVLGGAVQEPFTLTFSTADAPVDGGPPDGGPPDAG